MAKKKNKIIPINMISANDAAPMIIRGSLVAAPTDMREKYVDFFRPTQLDKSYDVGTSSVSKVVQTIFAQLVIEFERLQFPLEKKPTLHEINKQIREVINTAKKYIAILQNHQINTGDQTTMIIMTQLETITENIGTRKIVLAYPEHKTSEMGLYGSMGSMRKNEEMSSQSLFKELRP